jgi:hypothetical protein
VTGGMGAGQTATLIMPNTCLNRGNHDRVGPPLRRSDILMTGAGGLDS